MQLSRVRLHPICAMVLMSSLLLLTSCSQDDNSETENSNQNQSNNENNAQTPPPSSDPPPQTGAARQTPDETIAEAIHLIENEDFKTLYENYTLPEMKEFLTAEEFKELMEGPEGVNFILPLLEAAQKVKPEMTSTQMTARYILKNYSAGDRTGTGIVQLSKYEDGWRIQDFSVRTENGSPKTASNGNEMDPFVANNLKQIGLALHNYHEMHGHLPTDILDEDGKPLLSWRVALLPFLEEQPLYEQFKLDEPWDSEHNRPLNFQMPAVYHSIEEGDSPATSFLAPVGENTVLGPRPVSFSEVAAKDGNSQTIMVIHTTSKEQWTKPADFVFDRDNPREGYLTEVFKKDSLNLVLMADGSVRHIDRDTSNETLLWLFEYNDGNEVDW